MIRQFFNVLYRRILYKIPLKFLLILLAVFSVLIACAKADNVDTLITKICSDGTTTCVDSFSQSLTSSYKVIFNYNFLSDKTYCLRIKSSSAGNVKLYFGYTPNSSDTPTTLFNYWPGWSDNNNYAYVCSIGWNYFKGKSDTNTTIVGDMFELDSLLSSALPIYTSQQCQTEYNLIPISSVDSNYCTTNNLCPSQECPVGSGNISTLYINDILHVGAPFIYFDIPQEIGWDYTYTQGGTNMLIEVEGYNVDYEKIDNIVNTQSYTPNESDLSSIITDIVPLFVPGLVIILFLYFLFRFIKKIF